MDSLLFAHVLAWSSFAVNIISKCARWGCIFARAGAQQQPAFAVEVAVLVLLVWLSARSYHIWLAKPDRQKAWSLKAVTRAKLLLFGVCIAMMQLFVCLCS